MDCSTQGFPILYYLLEFAQIHVHWISDAIQPSRPLLSPSSCPQSFPASGSFLMSQLFTTGGQSIGASASASVLPMDIQGWFASGLTGLISLQSKGLSRVFSSTTVRKHKFFGAQPSFMVQLSYPYMTTGKTIALTLWTFVGKVMSLLFNMLSRFVSAQMNPGLVLTHWLLQSLACSYDALSILFVKRGISQCKEHHAEACPPCFLGLTPGSETPSTSLGGPGF